MGKAELQASVTKALEKAMADEGLVSLVRVLAGVLEGLVSLVRYPQAIRITTTITLKRMVHTR